jgi:hypothetical protein
MDMPSDDRRAFVRLLVDQIDRENAQIDQARGT